MTRKIPEHLRPLYDELTVTFKDGQFSNDAGQSFKTAKEAIEHNQVIDGLIDNFSCLLYTSPSPRDKRQSRMPSSA